MHSEDINCEMRAVLPTPWAPTKATLYVVTSWGVDGTVGKLGVSCGSSPGGARLLLRDLLLLNESPLLTIPKTNKWVIKFHVLQELAEQLFEKQWLICQFSANHKVLLKYEI